MLFRDSEEKGSDVNLATRLLVGGFNGEYEQAVVISNDADFAGAMRYVKDGLGLRATLVNPDPNNSSPRDLSEVTDRNRNNNCRRARPSSTATWSGPSAPTPKNSTNCITGTWRWAP